MTEHGVNNGSSNCQTEDATHVVVTYKDFKFDKTIGCTYAGERMELMFHFIADFESPDDRLILCITSISNKTWHIVVYDDAYDNSSNRSLKLLPAKETVELYSVRDYEFTKRDELIIFVKFGDENILLFDETIEEEEMLRMYKCLKLLYDEKILADMTVNNDHTAHRAVIAAASEVLDEAVTNLTLKEKTTEDKETTSMDLIPWKSDMDEDAIENSLNDDKMKLQQLVAAFSAFANELNINVKDESSFIQHLQNNVEVASSGDDSTTINFKQPDPSDYIMDFPGLNPNVLDILVRYIYTGELRVPNLIIEDFHSLMTAILSYKLEALGKLLENHLLASISNDKIIDLLNFSKKFRLPKLESKVLKHVRNLKFLKYHTQKIDDPFVHKCLLSTPSHNYKTHGIFTFKVPKISELTKYHSEDFYFCDCPLYVSVGKSDSDMSIYLYVKAAKKQKFSLTLNCQIFILPGNESQKHAFRSFSSIFPIHSKDKCLGYRSFLTWAELMDPENGFVKDDSISVQVYIEVMDM